MDKLFKIGQAAKALGVSPSTLRRWKRNGKINLFANGNANIVAQSIIVI